jgi:hypothetical protein
VVTASSAAWAHQLKGNISWLLSKKLLLMVSLGSLLGAFIAAMLSAQVLTTLFAGAVMLLAVYMLTSSPQEQEGAQPATIILRILGLFTGIMASLMGIAGGVILVPSLCYFSVPLRQAIGVATLCGVMVALFGSLGYIISGFNQPLLPPASLGYIYLPALLGIVLTSSLFARYGVQLASQLPVLKLKKFFAVFLLLVAVRMIIN